MFGVRLSSLFTSRWMALLWAVLVILTAIQFEERDLVDAFGDEYRNYRKNVPMLIPGVRPAAEEPAQSGATVRS